MSKIILLAVVLSSIITTQSYAKKIIAKFVYANMSYANSKEAILAGATTATAKGYNALLTNPAGLSSNQCYGIYARNVSVTKKTGGNSIINDDGKIVLSQNDNSDYLAVGLLANSLAIEGRKDDYVALGYGYGFYNRYGLFSIGGSYYADQSDFEATKDSTNPLDKDEVFGMGNHYVLGLMWQKTFIDIEDFYALYLGLSYKSSGLNKTGKIIIASPKTLNLGLGLETNLFSTTLLATIDYSNETWESINESLKGISFGLKWMLLDGLAVGVGSSKQTFTSNNYLDDITTLSTGVELKIWKIGVGLSGARKSINALDGTTYLTEDSVHTDFYISF